MKTLNLNELEEKISANSTDINYSDRVYAQDKISQFFAFLNEQTISKRILERINEDFALLKNELPPTSNNPGAIMNISHNVKSNVKSMIKTREDQGAFGFFIIQELFEKERKSENHYLNAPASWYDGITSDYGKRLDGLKENFFKPFIDLLEWYIYESQTKSDVDYFSKNEIETISARLDEIQSNQQLYSEVLFNEIDDLKELILLLNKKNWGEILKGKLGDLVVGEFINTENAKAIFNFIVENYPLLLK